MGIVSKKFIDAQVNLIGKNYKKNETNNKLIKLLTYTNSDPAKLYLRKFVLSALCHYVKSNEKEQDLTKYVNYISEFTLQETESPEYHSYVKLAHEMFQRILLASEELHFKEKLQSYYSMEYLGDMSDALVHTKPKP